MVTVSLRKSFGICLPYLSTNNFYSYQGTPLSPWSVYLSHLLAGCPVSPTFSTCRTGPPGPQFVMGLQLVLQSIALLPLLISVSPSS